MKYFTDNRGRTWKCIVCNSIFFIPEIILEKQKMIGCPICKKSKWKLVEYALLFIKESEKTAVLKNDLDIKDIEAGKSKIIRNLEVENATN